MTFTPLHNIPTAVVEENIIPRLDVSSALNFINCNKAVNTTFKKHFLKKEVFTELYGAISECEKDQSTKELGTRIARTLDINKKLGIDKLADFFWNIFKSIDPLFEKYLPSSPTVFDLSVSSMIVHQLRKRPLFLVFDEDGNPEIKENISFSTLSFLGRFKAKYKFYRGDYLRRINDRIKSIDEDYKKIVNEFTTQELNPDYPLQDLKDRSFRIFNIEKERRNLDFATTSSYFAYLKLCGQFSYLERIIFMVISFFHSLFSSPFKLNDFYEFKKFSKEFNTFVKKKTCQFNDSEITYKDGKIAVEIKANLSTYTGTVVFSIFDKNNNKLLGEIKFERIFPLNEKMMAILADDHKEVHDQDKLLATICDHLGWDPMNKDYPIRHLLIQLAIEIFGAASEEMLVIKFKRLRPLISESLLSRGFYWTGKNIAYLNKTSRPLHGLKTQFCKRDDQGQWVPALIDLEPGCPPITWEEQISKRPLLTNKLEFMLPKYNSRHLFDLEDKH